MNKALSLIVAGGLALACSGAHAQVVISEIFENPDGPAEGNDEFIEYIELYGKPGMDLTGYMVGLFKGGADENDNDIPDVYSEIDEAFSLDGLSIGPNGFLVLYNGTDAQSIIPGVLPMGATGDSFFDTHIPNPNDINGKLSNDQSSTYLLIRKRPFHRVVSGASVYDPGYAVWKDTNHDVDYDGKIDVGVETPVNRELVVPIAPPPEIVDPLQIIDEVAWSNMGGKEYVRSSEQEISETPGFNPDALSRLAYYGANPMLGQRINPMGQTVPTRTADESWIYGENIAPSIDFTYSDTLYGAPTDPGGDGFMDISIGTGTDAFKLTPGGFNDHTPTGIMQFRFVDGDLDFDGDADADDLALFDASLNGADLDATEDYIDPDTGMTVADPNSPGDNIQAYVFEGRLANAYLAAACLSDLDGTDVPGADDRAALVALVGGEPCDADFNGDGVATFPDVGLFLAAFQAGDPAADFNGDGATTFPDVGLFLAAFQAGCP